MKINATIAIIVMAVWFYTGLIWQTKAQSCTLKMTDNVGYSHLITGEAQ